MKADADEATWPKVTRVEVIMNSGRSFVQYFDIAGAYVSIQDEGRTMKVFVAGKDFPASAQSVGVGQDEH